MRDAILCRRAVAPIDSGMCAALLPVDAAADVALSKVPLGDIVAVRFAKDRSNQQNKLYHAILDFVAEATAWEDGRTLGQFVKVGLGYFDVVKSPQGKALAVAQSTAFDKMSHDQFCEFFDKAVRLICASPDVLGGHNPDDLIAEVCRKTGLPRPELAGTEAGDQQAEGSRVAPGVPPAALLQDRPGEPGDRQDGVPPVAPPAAPSDAPLHRTPPLDGTTDGERRENGGPLVSQPDVPGAGNKPAGPPPDYTKHLSAKPAFWEGKAPRIPIRKTSDGSTDFETIADEAFALIANAPNKRLLGSVWVYSEPTLTGIKRYSDDLFNRLHQAYVTRREAFGE